MVQKIVCKSTNCSNLILETTAERTDGYCMPCVQEIKRKEHQEYVRKNRRDLNEFEGVKDVIEVLKIIHEPRKYDPLINWIPYPTPTDRLYMGLGGVEKIRMAEYAAELIETERNNEAEQICLCLSAFTDASLEGCLRKFYSNQQVGPPLAYRDAPTDVRDQLIGDIETDAENRNQMLLALAWIGDSTVVDQFCRWRSEKPHWGSSLYVPPEAYAYEAGWELTPQGERRDLFFTQCFALESGASEEPSSFQAVVNRQDTCLWCASTLTNLIRVDLEACGVAEVLADGNQIEVLTCEFCTIFGNVFGCTDQNEKWFWSPKNERPEYLPGDSDSSERLPNDCLRIGRRRSIEHAADQFLPTKFSQLGGHPAWVQGSAYPNCLDCHRTMMFLAQVDHQDIAMFAEGTYFAFVCLDCMSTATVYQQT